MFLDPLLPFDSYNKEFIRLCNVMDEIWVPSKFSYDTLVASGGSTL